MGFLQTKPIKIWLDLYPQNGLTILQLLSKDCQKQLQYQKTIKKESQDVFKWELQLRGLYKISSRIHTYLLYQEKSFGMLAFAFFKWSSWSSTSSNLSMALQCRGEKKAQFLKLLAFDILIIYNHHYARHKLDMV